MATKKQQQRQKAMVIALAVMVTLSLAGLSGLGAGSHSGTQPQQEATPRDYGRVVCSTSEAFQISAQVNILADGATQTIPAFIGYTEDCPLEIRTDEVGGGVLVRSDIDREYTWNDFFNVWGVDPRNAPPYVLAGVIINGEDNPGQGFDFNIKIEDGQELILDYVSI